MNEQSCALLLVADARCFHTRIHLDPVTNGKARGCLWKTLNRGSGERLLRLPCRILTLPTESTSIPAIGSNRYETG